MNTEQTELLVVGTGALACLFAARLAQAGIPVTMLGSWPEGVAALRKRGVGVIEAQGEEHYYPVQVITEAELSCRFRAALVLVKAWGTRRAAEQLSRCLVPEGAALTLQNGIGNRETLASFLGEERVALGTTTTGAYLPEPGKVRPAGDGVVSIGAHPRASLLVEALRVAGFTVEIVPDATLLLWGKLVVNAAINPLTAILRVTNGQLLERPEASQLLEAAAREAAAVAAANHVTLPYPDPVETVRMVARRTGKNYSSMLQDVMRGAPTEVDAINGAVVRAGEQAGVPTPVNHTLWRLVKALQG